MKVPCPYFGTFLRGQEEPFEEKLHLGKNKF
jgi:hypothetical protein